MNSRTSQASPESSRTASFSGVRDGERSSAGQNPLKHAQILEGAAQVFREMGFDAASMNDITRSAGVSKGTVYAHFSNKEELFEAIMEDERRKLFADLYDILVRKTEEGVGETEAEIRKILINFGVALSHRICSDSVICAQRAVIAVASRMPELGQRFFENGPLRGQTILAKYLGAVVEKGLLSIADPDLAACQLSELCVAGIMRARLFAHASDPPDDKDIRRIVTSGIDMFLSAYRA